MVYSTLSRLAWILLLVLFAAAPVLSGLQVNGCFARIHDSCAPVASRLVAAVVPANGQLMQQVGCCRESAPLAGCSHCQCERANHPVFRETAAVITVGQGGVQAPVRVVSHPLWHRQSLPAPAELIRQPFSLALILVEQTILLI